jgi:hypothetical protein
MVSFFSDIDTAIDHMTKAVKYSRQKLFLAWTRYGQNKAEFKLCTPDHIIKNSAFILFETEKGMIKKNVKPFNYFRQWTKEQ